jgi:hypothetical protein
MRKTISFLGISESCVSPNGINGMLTGLSISVVFPLISSQRDFKILAQKLWP